jgi:hypothetical protein
MPISRPWAAPICCKRAGPRYWQPNEPVVLLIGPQVKPTDRHGQTAALRCRVQAFDLDQVEDATNASARTALIDGLFGEAAQAASSQPPGDMPGFRSSQGSAWQPLLLEWKVEVQPLGGDASNLNPATRKYGERFISDNYRLAENRVDWRIAPGAASGVANTRRWRC